MSEPLFAFDRRNYRQCQQLYRGVKNQEYYLGNYSIEPNPVIDVRADRRAAGTSAIIALRSRNRLFFRRSWAHIQADGTDVAVLWFVKRGSLSISHQTGQSLAKAGDFAVTHSGTPFFMECRTDSELVHEVLHAVIPSHQLRRFIPAAIPTGFCTAANSREFLVAERLFRDVFEDAGRMSGQTSELLVEGALSLLHDAVAERDFRQPPRKSVGDCRLEEVLRFIDIHFCDPSLNLATVAQACGISARYVALLLERNGTSFSTIVWDKRLQAAKEWLSSAGANGVPLNKVAYRVGFKSAAHFSRRFKQAFDMSPEEYRCAGPAQPCQS
jgi:AraC-like DNA-binding protein